MNVPLLDLETQNLALEAELNAAFNRVLRSGRFILGKEVEDFEDDISEMAAAAFGIGVTSGTDAILLALMALDIQPGDEILCPSFTFFATAGCIARIGAVPVFVDAREDTFNLDVDDARKKITSKTKAIIPVHLFGQAADMDKVMALANEHNLFVIEDAAQALGAKYNGRPVGGIGHFGAFSFFPSKNLGGFGDGGMLVCNDEALAERARILRTHGSEPKYYHKYIGGNFRLDALQAALLRVKVPHYDRYTRGRQENAAYYNAKIQETLMTVSGRQAEAPVVLPANLQGDGHIWNQFTIRVTAGNGRDSLREHLSKNGIGAEVYYPIPLHAQECFANQGQNNSCPVAARLARQVISLPVFPELTGEQRDTVVQVIRSWVEQTSG